MSRIKFETNIGGTHSITDCPHDFIDPKKVGSVMCSACPHHIRTDGDKVECGYGEGKKE